ncbi:hypothetical protein BN946_scf184937.g15 [Trametes cinnabarina]|uniref:Uncharacterized protein n=1 Tax=Pycnoporus cinnabarinus TaxID=5643 RepID=A0A060SQH0_PYCCI|nr:hypothetical protein BN946_scf184937.g15 [Trametes cinnabarina]
MFFFSTLSVIATVALSAFISAAPLQSRADLPVVGDLSAVTGLTSGLPVMGDVLRRTDAPQGLAAIFTQAQAQLVPFTQQLKFATKQNATAEGLAAPIDEIKTILTNTVGLVQGLIGQPVEVVLATVDGTAKLTIEELAPIVGSVVILVFDALGAVLTLLGGGVIPAVFDLLAGVGAVVGTLLAAVFALLGQVVPDVVAILASTLRTVLHDVVPFILHLNIATVLHLLGL